MGFNLGFKGLSSTIVSHTSVTISLYEISLFIIHNMHIYLDILYFHFVSDELRPL